VPKILGTDYPSRTEQNRKRLIAKPAKLAFDAGKIQRAVFPAVSQASETMESAFGDFNDEGGFFRNLASFEVGAIVGVAIDIGHCQRTCCIKFVRAKPQF
jgi:hypothetical protein